MAPSHPSTTSSFLIANLHCPSCVSTIKDALQDVQGISWVSPNVVTSWVVVQHDPVVPAMQMASRLQEAGFELSSISTTHGDDDLAELLRGDTSNVIGHQQITDPSDIGQLDGAIDRISRISDRLRQTRTPEEQARAHLNNCEQCRTQGPKLHGSCVNDNITANAQDQKSHGVAVMSTRSLSTADHVAPRPSAIARSWKASLAIAGMTCAACSNSITESLNQKDWVNNVTINLIAHSGTVEFTGEKEDAAKIVDSIEEIGFEAHLDQVEAVGDGQDIPRLERVVEIHIEGFYCEHCAERLSLTLSGFDRDIDIINHPTLKRPILKIKYIPDIPAFGIRRILDAIEASDKGFKATIYHPPSLEERSRQIHAEQQKRILRRVVVTLIVTIPTFIIGIVYMSLVPDSDPGKRFLMVPWTSGLSRAQIALFVMATPVYFFAADIFHRRAMKEVKALWRRGSRTPFLQRFYRFGSMNMLMSLGTTIAYVSSVSQMIAAAVDQSYNVKDSNFYFDSVVFLTLFLLVGRLIEAYSKSKTGDAVDALGKLRPTKAILVHRDSEKEWGETIDTDRLDFGDTVRIPHGTSPPCDGKVTKGETVFDESSLTGESRPIKKRVGDQVYSGTVNKGTPVLVQVTGVAGQSMLDQIVNVVREGQTKRAPMEKVADMLTAYFVPVVTLIAILTWLIWLIAGISGAVPAHFLNMTSGSWVAFSLQFAIAVFVVACPCGLALAAPTAIFVGGGLAAKHGILVKGGGEAFEKASRIDCVVFDKTGTLTMGGEPKITDLEVFVDQKLYGGEPRNSLLAALRAVEENSSHPIAKAIVSFCQSQTSERVSVSDIEEIPGKGLMATYKSKSGDQAFDIIVGNEGLMFDFALTIPAHVSTSLQRWKTEAKSVALVATRPRSTSSSDPASFEVAVALAISDPVRPETPAVIQALRSRGTDVWMLSGDNAVTAKAVALRIGIPEENVIAEVLPAQKYEKITYLQSTLKARRGNHEEHATKRATIAMVGDGINDAPALTTADVGIAVGSGSDVAISSADFVLVHSHLGSVVTLLGLSRTVFRRIKFNFGWALIYNLVALPVAAGCLYPIIVNGQHVRLDPVWASLAMALSSISVVMSSLALRSGIPGLGFRVREFVE
ncbi:heavy metal translocatin [Xylariaceae sp. FL0016]|nr:heavy metal translocatin [Xylariaceae sp. FL0016]